MVNGQWSMVNGHIVNSHFIIYSPHTHHTPPLREALRVVPSGTLRERSRSWGTHRSPLPWGSGDWGLGPPLGLGEEPPVLRAVSPLARLHTPHTPRRFKQRVSTLLLTLLTSPLLF